jgi:hypothetical protein
MGSLKASALAITRFPDYPTQFTTLITTLPLPPRVQQKSRSASRHSPWAFGFRLLAPGLIALPISARSQGQGKREMKR